eukprot:c40597_g1_i1 orf=75-299(-)
MIITHACIILTRTIIIVTMCGANLALMPSTMDLKGPNMFTPDQKQQAFYKGSRPLVSTFKKKKTNWQICFACYL